VQRRLQMSDEALDRCALEKIDRVLAISNQLASGLEEMQRQVELRVVTLDHQRRHL
jgi:hypothetical protein